MLIANNETYALRTWDTADAPSLARHPDNKKIWGNCRG